MSEDRENFLFAAELSEQAERYEEMVNAVNGLVKAAAGSELTPQERNFLSIAYKNITGVRRGSWRILWNLETKEDTKISSGTGNETSARKLEQTKSLRMKVEKEMKEICTDIVCLLDKTLIPSATTPESKVFYYKMKGDYYRYMAEFTSGDRKEVTDAAHEAYKKAQESADSLAFTHPVRLGLALNFSVFYYEIMGKPDRACQIAKTAFDDAIAELDNLSEESYKDSTLIMQLLRDNLTLWSAEVADENEPNGAIEMDKKN